MNNFFFNINVYTSFNNIIITVSNNFGKPLFWTSSGVNGFKGAKKSTPFAAQRNINSIKDKIMDLGISNVRVLFKGKGPGREAILRILESLNLNIIAILDITPISHNGCRPKKKRRV